MKPPRRRLAGVGGGATVVVGLRGGALVLNLVVALQLGRTLGVAGFGAYAAGIGLAQILSVLASIGGGPLLVREVAAHGTAGDAALLRGLLTRMLQGVLAATCLVGAGVAVALLVADAGTPVTAAMLAGTALVPLLALALLAQAALQGRNRLVAAFAPPLVLRPLVLLVLLVVLPATGIAVSPTGAVALHGAALALTLGLTGVLVWRRLAPALQAVAASYETRRWARSGMAFGVLTALTAVGLNAGVTLAGAIAGGHEAGLLGAATRVSVVVILLAWASADALQPTVARLHAAGRRAELQRVVTRLTRRVAAGTAVAAVATAALAQPLLELFGDGFADGAAALRWLCVAAVVNAIAAPNMTLLTMTEHERAAAATAAAGAAMTVALCVLLIPRFGAAGAAAAYTAGSVLRNALASRWTLTRLGIESTVLGRPGGLSRVAGRR